MKQSITVTEKISADAPASIDVVTAQKLEETPGVDMDDVLRIVPGFSLYRRSSGVSANPTTQGVSLRGLGSSGASRTLVLWDGIPVNSPFGGWVYWDRLAPDEIGQVEISRGASTSVFGDKAMGGAVTLFTREPQPWRMTLFADGGGQNTAEVGGGLSNTWQHVAVSGFVRAFDTDGYFIVPASIRGAIDTPAGLEFVAGNLKIDFFGQHDRAFLKLDILAEDRKNGTSLTNNSTSLGTLAGSWSHEISPTDNFSILAYHTREVFRSTYTSVAADRNSEKLTDIQDAPSEAVGAAGFYRHDQSRWTILAGGDFDRVEGQSNDTAQPTNVLTTVGGTRIESGFFGQSDFRYKNATFFLGAREDFINGNSGNNSTFFSPSAGAAIGKGKFRGRASVYRSFRAPTLNELYRQFRTGNTLTLANGNLVPEKLFGAETGLDIVGETRRFSVTAFRNSVNDVISNVTLTSTPSLITKQRQNAAEAITHGLEANFQQNWRAWRGELSYLYADSRYVTGNRVPQVPKHQGSAQLIWQHRGTMVAGGIRAYSWQYEDDLNTPGFRMAGFATLLLSARQQLRKSLAATLEMENLTDHVYYTGFTPAPQIGPPRTWRLGLRWDGPVR